MDYSNILNAMKQQKDRMAMEDETRQGPHLPEITEDESAVDNNSLGLATMGITKMAAPNVAETAAKVALDVAPNMKSAQLAQQVLNREMMSADRLRAGKFAAIKKLLGQ